MYKIIFKLKGYKCLTYKVIARNEEELKKLLEEMRGYSKIIIKRL